MKLDITKPDKAVRVDKGDMVVLKRDIYKDFIHFLIVQDKVTNEYCLLNLEVNNVLANVRGETIGELVVEMTKRLKGEIYEVVSSENLVLSRKSN